MTGSPRLRRPQLGPLTRINASGISVLVFAMIGLVASFSTWHINQGLPRDRQARDVLERIRLDAAQLKGLEWRFIATKKVEARDTLASELILDDMSTQSKEIAGLHRAGGTDVAVRALIAAFRQLAPALAAQDSNRAGQVYLTRYLPARNRLQQVLRASNRAAEQRLEAAERDVKIGMILSILAAVLLIAMLAVRVNRVRVREIRNARKADSALSERDELLLDSRRKLLSAERLYRELVERLPGVTYISSPSSVAPTYISPQAFKLLGRSADEFVSHPETAMQIIYPDDRERVEANMRALRRVGGEYVQEFRVVHPDGRIVWVGDQATVVAGTDDKPFHVQGYMQDITPLKDAEAKQQAALEMEQAANEKLRELGVVPESVVPSGSPWRLELPSHQLQGGDPDVEVAR